MTIISDYLNNIARAVKAGNATEHTYRPALKSLLEALCPSVEATNEPQRIECGAPDYIVTRKGVPLGYIEAKDVGADLDTAERSEQLQRYRASLTNLILTNYLEFRLYRNGELVRSAQLGTAPNNTLRKSADGPQEVPPLLQLFFDADVPTINNARELAERMARLARLLHDLIRQVFAQEGQRGDLHGQYEAFKKVLIADLSIDQFADMYAQTIAYGLFAARCNHIGVGFTREHAGSELPKTNPFLRKLFNTVAGVDLDERISWAVDDLAHLLARADMATILTDFGKATRREDPVVHFYETFLSAYDPKMREMRGVYYTPEPVVDYIVRSVNALLKRDFGLKEGLADSGKVKLEVATPHGKCKTKTITSHRVQMLDPACGTGTFLHAIVGQIREGFLGSKGLWPSYVAEHLLPRLYGFELLMAPYAVAHMKLGLQLRESGYDFATDERLRVFLTNTLEQAHEHAGLPLFAQWLSDEAAAASEVKREVPIMVVLGNPPYSGHSSNKGAWIEGLMESYKQSPALKKPAQAKWLSDDYVKFIRFAQWRIEQTGYGVLGFISNHSYLDNPTFLDMRASLMASFDDIYILDLHGNSKKKEIAPDGAKDENVFDIQQGVAICFMVKRQRTSGGTKEVRHADLWGERAVKYAWLAENDVSTTKWQRIVPRPPRLLFVPQDEELLAEYERGWSIVEAMNQNGDPAPGIVTTHDDFAISWTRDDAIAKVERLLATNSEGEARAIWRLCSQNQWNYSRAKQQLASGEWRENVVPIMYRPFDVRWTVYDRNVAVHRRERVNGHMLKENLAMVFGPSGKVIGSDDWDICFVSDHPTDYNLFRRGGNFLFPLWLYESTAPGLLAASPGKHANYSIDFLADLKSKSGAVPITPDELFAYLYAVLCAPSYRTRYSAFLKRGFPRVPITSDTKLCAKLVALGQRLIDLHLLRAVGSPLPDYPVAGDNRVDKVGYVDGRVYINAEQYFDAVPQSAWSYQIGGYQVAHKWLKDRKGRLLTFDNLQHYRHVIAALNETIRLQADIDAAILRWPLT